MTDPQEQRYEQAVAALRSALQANDCRAHLAAIEGLVPLLIQRGETLASSRRLDEGFTLLAQRDIGLGPLHRARIGARFVRLWWKSGQSAQADADPSKYWFFRT